MNCDEAFDQMTQLGGSADPHLESHLASCRRCREMQETLSPAIGLFEADAQSIGHEPWRNSSESPTELATQTARRLTESTTRRPKLGFLLGYAAAVFLGAGLVWGTLVLQRTESSASAGWSREDCRYIADHRPSTISASVFMQNCLACHQANRNESPR